MWRCNKDQLREGATNLLVMQMIGNVLGKYPRLMMLLINLTPHCVAAGTTAVKAPAVRVRYQIALLESGFRLRQAFYFVKGRAGASSRKYPCPAAFRDHYPGAIHV